MQESPTAVAGWYADPTRSDQWRYWDGRHWTEDVAPRSPELTALAGPAVPAWPWPATGTPTGHRGVWIAIVVAFVTLLIALGGFVGLHDARVIACRNQAQHSADRANADSGATPGSPLYATPDEYSCPSIWP